MAFNNMNRYESRGLNDFRITTVEDIKEIYGYEILELKGYSDLSPENQVLFQKFIINFYNAHGLGNRMIFIPTQINYVQHTEYSRFSYVDDEKNDVYEVVGAEFKRLNSKGKFVKFLKYFFYDEVILENCKSYSSSFLRIDYKWDKRREWLHIIEPNKWY